MDWSRAKNILIVLFLILNIFLFVTILHTEFQLSFGSGYADYALRYLDSREIEIETEIPDAADKMGTLAYTDRDFDFKKLTRYVFGKEVTGINKDDSLVYSDGEEKIVMTDERLLITEKPADGQALFNDSELFLQKVYDYSGNIGYRKRDLCLELMGGTDEKKQVVLVLKYKNALLFDQTIRADISKDGVMILSFPTVEVRKMNPAREIISAYQLLVMSKMPEGTRIKGAALGYKQTEEGELYDAPVWRIELGDGKIIYYNAYTGEELR